MFICNNYRELCRITSVGTRTFDALDSPLDDGKTEEGGEMTIGDTNTAYLLAIKEVIVSYFNCIGLLSGTDGDIIVCLR